MTKRLAKGSTEKAYAHQCEALALIELIFFAYRDFTAEADAILAEEKLGRAHHRVLHFVSHHQGMTINELLDILTITKQSLSRVLRELTDGLFIDVRVSENDRRNRLLFPTAKGQTLYKKLLDVQTDQIERALVSIDETERPVIKKFLTGLIADDKRIMALDLIEEKRHRL